MKTKQPRKMSSLAPFSAAQNRHDGHIRACRTVAALLLCLSVIPLIGINAHAQATRDWVGGGGAWLDTAKWTGGIFAGDAPNAVLTGEGLADDIASFTNGSATIGIQMTTLNANDGVGLTLAAISIGNSGSGTAITIECGTSSATNGILQLNGGVTLGSGSGATPNSLIKLYATGTTGTSTITRTNSNGNSLGLRLGTTNGVIDVGTSRTLSIEANISEVGAGSGFEKRGAGTLILSGSNTHSGTNLIRGGTLRLTSANALGSAVLKFGDENAAANNLSFAVGGAFDVTNTIYIPETNGSGTKIAQTSGGGITASFSGRIIADGNNFRINAQQTTGNLRVSNTNALAPNTVASNVFVRFQMNSGQDLTDSAVWAGDGSLEYTRTAGASGGSLFVSGQKVHTGGSRIQNLLGTSANGTVVVSDSSQGPAGAPTSGPFGTGTLALNNNAYLRADTTQAADVTIGNPVTLSSTNNFPTTSGEYSLIFTGPATLTGDCVMTVDVGSSDPSKSVRFEGALGEDGVSRSLTKAGSGRLVLNGANTYTGNTTNSSGTLEMGQPTFLFNSTVDVASGATLKLNFTGTNKVAALVLGGVSEGLGVYNNANRPTYITGPGSIEVATPPLPPQPTLTSTSVSSTNLAGLVGTVFGYRYVLQTTTNLSSPVIWTSVSTNVGTGSNLSWSVPIGAEDRMFARFSVY